MSEKPVKPVPLCDKCKRPMTLKVVEHVVALPAPTLILKTYGCDHCHPSKK